MGPENPKHLETKLYKEAFRPQFHFSSPLNWINDPNGLVFFDGEFHLFFQHNPIGIRWGHISWGHAISSDLIHWQHLPLAIPEENGVMIFSGGCVIDKNNTAGFAEKLGDVPLVAIYTGHAAGRNQSQNIAYSNDKGRTWKKYENNPVLDLGIKDFRDPQVFWYEPHEKWVMSVVLATEKKIQFYCSTNLKEWKILSSFGPAGDTSGIWECPDLFEAPLKGEPGKTKWVLMHSPAPHMQYFVGDFDGTSFTNENPSAKIYRPDYGPDYYAAIVYKNGSMEKSPVSIGWANNWKYAQDIPTTPWRSAMSLPRVLCLTKMNDEWLLMQEPVPSICTLRSAPLLRMKNRVIKKTDILPVKSQHFELDCSIEFTAASTFGLRFFSGTDHDLEVGYDNTSQTLYMDRSKTGNISFNKTYEKLGRYETNLVLNNAWLELRVFVDKSIVEVFANNGQVVMTMQVFPDETDSGMEIFCEKGKILIKNLTLWEIKSIW
jgi:fructan beta-fructosidase